jgi:predicted RNA-binding protein Jag
MKIDCTSPVWRNPRGPSPRHPPEPRSHGRNGLHCVAAAILSPESLLSKYRKIEQRDSSIAPEIAKLRKLCFRPTVNVKGNDSSHDRLALRRKIVLHLIEAGVDVNHYEHDGNTVLMAFAAELPEDDDYKTPVSILTDLIEAGANVDAHNRSALHVAVRRGRKLAMRTLVQAGANVYARDGEWRSVLDVADVKIRQAKDVKSYAHFEACRAWLSGAAMAVQDPTVLQEWGVRTGAL